jgi:hypothetical protein
VAHGPLVLSGLETLYNVSMPLADVHILQYRRIQFMVDQIEVKNVKEFVNTFPLFIEWT